MTTAFSRRLEEHGPNRGGERPASPEAARDYCRKLAKSHYENFTVASRLLPRRLRQHFYNVYAYCRWADDLADESPNEEEALALLDWWRRQLDDCYRGRATHPVFVALTETIEEFSIPIEPFADLLSAFRQDQRVKRYETFDELLDYCRRSANPVGRIVLYLGRSFNDQNAALADNVCTGLQLANFWQDVARDLEKGRAYLPVETRRKHGYTDAMLAGRTFNQAFVAVLRQEVDRAEQYLLSGRPLIERVSPDLRIDVELFIAGGLAVLNAIRRQNYDVWRRRPRIGKLKKLRLLIGAWWRSRGKHGK